LESIEKANSEAQQEYESVEIHFFKRNNLHILDKILIGEMNYIPGSINLSLSVPFVYSVPDNASEERTRKTKSDIQTSTPHCIMLSTMLY
jgi:hypothetical protein